MSPKRLDVGLFPTNLLHIPFASQTASQDYFSKLWEVRFGSRLIQPQVLDEKRKLFSEELATLKARVRSDLPKAMVVELMLLIDKAIDTPETKFTKKIRALEKKSKELPNLTPKDREYLAENFAKARKMIDFLQKMRPDVPKSDSE